MGVIRNLFGPSKEEIWKQLCAETGASYVEGSFWKGSKVEAAHGEWTVTLDTYTVSTGKAAITYTRMRAPYANPSGFRFTVYRHGFFSDIGKFMGMQDVTVGFEEFDRDFIIKGNDPQKLRNLFSNQKVPALITSQTSIYFTVKDDEGAFGTNFPEGVDELYFAVTGIIIDVDRLKMLYDLFAETLDELCRMGTATDKPADVKL